jgi:hypothetical protein
MPQDSLERHRLRRLLAQEGGLLGVFRLSDAFLLRHSERFPVIERFGHQLKRLRLPGIGPLPEPTPPAEDEQATELTWIEWRVLVEATGEPVEGMKLWIKPPGGGASQQHVTDSDGRVRLDGIEPGTWVVEKMEEPAA